MADAVPDGGEPLEQVEVEVVGAGEHPLVRRVSALAEAQVVPPRDKQRFVAYRGRLGLRELLFHRSAVYILLLSTNIFNTIQIVWPVYIKWNGKVLSVKVKVSFLSMKGTLNHIL